MPAEKYDQLQISMLKLLVAGLLLALVPHCFAQSIPDAGSIFREVVPVEPPTLPKQSAPIAPTTPSKEYPNNVTVVIHQFKLEGNELLNEAVLFPLVTDFLEREIGVNDLHVVTAIIARHYRDQGFLARVILPRQEIGNGVVTVKIIEANYSGIDLQVQPRGDVFRTSPVLIEKIFGARQSKTDPVYLPDLERSLLLAQDWPGLNLSGSLKAGDAEGESGLLVMAENAPLYTGRATFDNYGSRNTGSPRFTGSVSANAPLGRGERFRFNWLLTEGTRYARTEVSMPIGYDGWRIGVDASYLDYRIVNDDFASLGLEGNSSVFGSTITYPLIRTNRKNLILNGRLEHKRFNNKASGFTDREYKINDLSLGLQGNVFDDMGHGGVTSVGLDLIVGDTDKEQGDPTAGGFSVWRYWLERHQILSTSVSVTFSISGQRTSRSLDSALQFNIGGAYNMRAYPVSEGRGSEGDLLNLKLNWRPPVDCNCTLNAFIDYGRIKPLKTGEDNGSYYKSIGLQTDWRGSNGWFVTGTLARRLGNNPLPTSTGFDQDGSLKETRLWFMIGKSF